MVYLNLSGNYLGDKFALQLANTLKINKVLYEVDISNNPITEKGAIKLRDVLIQANDTISSFGNLKL